MIAEGGDWNPPDQGPGDIDDDAQNDSHRIPDTPREESSSSRGTDPVDELVESLPEENGPQPTRSGGAALPSPETPPNDPTTDEVDPEEPTATAATEQAEQQEGDANEAMDDSSPEAETSGAEVRSIPGSYTQTPVYMKGDQVYPYFDPTGLPIGERPAPTKESADAAYGVSEGEELLETPEPAAPTPDLTEDQVEAQTSELADAAPGEEEAVPELPNPLEDIHIALLAARQARVQYEEAVNANNQGSNEDDVDTSRTAIAIADAGVSREIRNLRKAHAVVARDFGIYSPEARAAQETLNQAREQAAEQRGTSLQSFIGEAAISAIEVEAVLLDPATTEDLPHYISWSARTLALPYAEAPMETYLEITTLIQNGLTAAFTAAGYDTYSNVERGGAPPTLAQVKEACVEILDRSPTLDETSKQMLRRHINRLGQDVPLDEA